MQIKKLQKFNKKFNNNKWAKNKDLKVINLIDEIDRQVEYLEIKYKLPMLYQIKIKIIIKD